MNNIALGLALQIDFAASNDSSIAMLPKLRPQVEISHSLNCRARNLVKHLG